MSTRSIRIWVLVHRWTSLVPTVFLLMLCVTGLPLVFGDEIERWSDGVAAPGVPGAAIGHLDAIAAQGRARFPGETLFSAVIVEDEGFVRLYMVPSWDAYAKSRAAAHWMDFDATTGRPRGDQREGGSQTARIMTNIQTLHTDLFAGLPGRLFLAGMAGLLVAALASGVVLYGPFARKQPFGAIRRGRSKRTTWLDLHNLLGIATGAWLVTVGVTGLMNEITTPLFRAWQQSDVAAMLVPWRGQPPLDQRDFSALSRAARTAIEANPGMMPASVVFPGHPVGSPHHYLFWMKGSSALLSRLQTPALIDARTGTFSGRVAMPFHLRFLQLCRPLHFGDYGGLPFKIMWALLDLVTILVLGSGVYLWAARGRRAAQIAGAR